MLNVLAYLWRLVSHAFGAWWDWVWGDTITGLVATAGTAIVGAWLLPRLATYLPSLNRFAGEDTMDSFINAAGVGLLFALVCFAVFLVRAPYQVHHELEQKVATLELELEEAKRKLGDGMPKFRAEVVQNMIGTNDEGYAFAFFVVRVSNTGAPSILDGWMAEATIDGQVVTGLLISTLNGTTLPHADGTKLHYGPGDMLQQKTIAAPIPTGSVVVGTLYFQFRGHTWQQLVEASKRKEWRISCLDSHNSEVTAVFGTSQGDPGEPRAFPGLNPTISPEK